VLNEGSIITGLKVYAFSYPHDKTSNAFYENEMKFGKECDSDYVSGKR